ncbi:TetR/AcrR family transcriptional regulator [Litchfieldia salsa]|uniref:DNA-binding transcriptional regulator, AcrR family n=1 Tax=Litchfieldia salsa TaxID=930152 RepID=A0A1H0W5U8_9BACI|nr:TetR/AcrR family transcriptional regulator [Litchfieldia salsa]SDP85963.1 DNA-binding transcriptional regulator, AcrR family [Litchfieldia salsa]
MESETKEQTLQQTIERLTGELEKEKRKNKSKEKILDAAINMFSQKGFDNSSTSDIAKEAGVAEVTLFRNFQSKNNLLYQILSPLFIKMTSPIILKEVKSQFSAVEGASEEVLISIFKDRLDLIEKNNKVVQVLLREALNREEILESIVNNITIPAKKEALEFVQRMKDKGEFRDVQEQAVVDLLFYTMFGYVLSHHVFQIETFSNEQDEVVETLVDLLLNGLKSN